MKGRTFSPAFRGFASAEFNKRRLIPAVSLLTFFALIMIPKCLACENRLDSFSSSSLSSGLAPVAYSSQPLNNHIKASDQILLGQNTSYQPTSQTIRANPLYLISDEKPPVTSTSSVEKTRPTQKNSHNASILKTKKVGFLLGLGGTVDLQDNSRLTNPVQLSRELAFELKEVLAFATDLDERDFDRFQSSMNRASKAILSKLELTLRPLKQSLAYSKIQYTKDLVNNPENRKDLSGVSFLVFDDWLHLTRQQFQAACFGENKLPSSEFAYFQHLLSFVYDSHDLLQHVGQPSTLETLQAKTKNLQTQLEELGILQQDQRPQTEIFISGHSKLEKKPQLKGNPTFTSVQAYTPNIPFFNLQGGCGYNFRNQTLDIGFGRAGLFGSKNFGVLAGLDAGCRWTHENSSFLNSRYNGLYCKVFLGVGVDV